MQSQTPLLKTLHFTSQAHADRSRTAVGYGVFVLRGSGAIVEVFLKEFFKPVLTLHPESPAPSSCLPDEVTGLVRISHWSPVVALR